jgi:hypothetical protein
VSRFVYGRLWNIWDLKCSIDIFKFAHEMQIDSLLLRLEDYFAGVPADQVMAVVDLLKMTGVQNGDLLAHCKMVVYI